MQNLHDVSIDELCQQDQQRLNTVIQFAENVLREGRDRYRPAPTPLFADGLNLETKEHVTWRIPGQSEIVISDLACQQNLLRTLTALTNLTGNPVYKDAAQAAISYMFEHYTDRNGLLFWGGHRMIDLRTLTVAGPANKDLVHELKNAFPYYELMDEVNPEATARHITACWNAHIVNWENLELNRHGPYDKPLSTVWAHPLVDLPILREANGLSFINIGNDLMYAAGTLARLHGHQDAWAWAKHLARQYVRTRHPKTGLGAYQFTQPKNTGEITSDRDSSKFGDRARRQFGPEFGDIALEGNVLLDYQGYSIYRMNALMQLQLAHAIGREADDLLQWTISGLRAFAHHAYQPESNTCKPMFTDGTDLTGYILPRDGYYGPAGTRLEPYPADGFLISYARAYLLTGDAEMWTTARQIAQGNGLGDLGSRPGQNVHVNLTTDSADAQNVFAILDLYQATRCPDYLALARTIGNNIVARHVVDGYFVHNPKQLYAPFDMVEPLALLALQAAIEGKPDVIPAFLGGKGFINGAYEYPDGTIDPGMTDFEIYAELRR